MVLSSFTLKPFMVVLGILDHHVTVNPCHGHMLKPFQGTHRWRSQIRPMVPCGDFAVLLGGSMPLQGHKLWKRAHYPAFSHWLWMPSTAFLQGFHLCA